MDYDEKLRDSLQLKFIFPSKRERGFSLDEPKYSEESVKTYESAEYEIAQGDHKFSFN